jgi:hypothetical protein
MTWKTLDLQFVKTLCPWILQSVESGGLKTSPNRVEISGVGFVWEGSPIPAIRPQTGFIELTWQSLSIDLPGVPSWLDPNVQSVLIYSDRIEIKLWHGSILIRPGDVQQNFRRR